MTPALHNLFAFHLLGISALLFSTTSAAIFAQSVEIESTPLVLDLGTAHQLEVKTFDITTEIITKGTDPFLYTKPLNADRPKDATILAFEYFCPKSLNHLQVYYGKHSTEARSTRLGKLNSVEGWVEYSAELKEDIKEWGKTGDRLRLDFGNRPNIKFQVRNLQIRTPTEREQRVAAERDSKKQADDNLTARLTAYLGTQFNSKITGVAVENDKVTVTGHIDQADYKFGTEFVLAEIPTEADVTEFASWNSYANKPIQYQPLKNQSFSLQLPRYVIRHEMKIDLALSKWAILRKAADGTKKLCSHARHPDSIVSAHTFSNSIPTNKKGIGGFSVGRGKLSDIEELGISSVTVNVNPLRMMTSRPSSSTVTHVYEDRNYYFNAKQVERLDATTKFCRDKNLVVAAILLIDRQQHSLDPEIGRIMEHPDYLPQGIYSMPNLTNPEGVSHYAAALDFLASRYNRPDEKYGRIHHFIMHNEIDAGWVWTNAGEKTALSFFDCYYKSMRLAHAILRNHYQHGKVFISLTHHWAWTSHPKFYPAKQLMQYLLDYCRAEGDFEWAIAHHPYPESLHEPKVWLDKKVTNDFNSPLITFKNIEVLDAWVHQPEVLFNGKIKRTVWLSENGTNSPDYSPQNLSEQAAGFAYAWKKIARLDGIDAFQWHNWFDNRHEGGLRIGLRKFPDDEHDPSGKKPVWYAFQAAGTEQEQAVFAPFLQLVK